MSMMLRRRILPLSGIFLLLLAGFAMAKIGNGQAIPLQVLQDPSKVTAAVRKGGLREAARIKGKYVGSVNTTGWLKYDVESLTQNSPEIVVGIPITSVSQLSTDGELIITEYQVRVEKILKGKLHEDQLISVDLPGGKIIFDDGTSAEIQTPDLEPMEPGKPYVLFLKTTNDNPDSFRLTGGGQGLFELSNARSVVKPHGHHLDLVQKHKNEQVVDFLEEIKAVVRTQSKATDCCN